MCTRYSNLPYGTHTGRHIHREKGRLATYIYTQGSIYREVYTLRYTQGGIPGL